MKVASPAPALSARSATAADAARQAARSPAVLLAMTVKAIDPTIRNRVAVIAPGRHPAPLRFNAPMIQHGFGGFYSEFSWT